MRRSQGHGVIGCAARGGRVLGASCLGTLDSKVMKGISWSNVLQA